jgi:4-hydroxybutyryl-CoA dehydratase/vinylacetyl-CoA-Delta-isomerase
MAIRTEQEYRERIKKLRPKLFFGGKRVLNLNDHPISKGVIDATARVYQLTMDPQYAGIMTPHPI